MKKRDECPTCGRSEPVESVIGRLAAGGLATAILIWCAVAAAAGIDRLVEMF